MEASRATTYVVGTLEGGGQRGEAPASQSPYACSAPPTDHEERHGPAPWSLRSAAALLKPYPRQSPNPTTAAWGLPLDPQIGGPKARDPSLGFCVGFETLRSLVSSLVSLSRCVSGRRQRQRKRSVSDRSPLALAAASGAAAIAAMAMDITQVLLNAQSPDGGVRKLAEDNLKQFEQNLPLFFSSLAMELANNSKPAESRRLAGLILKNSLDAKDAQRKQELVQKWLALDPSVKSQIKGSVTMALASSAPEAAHTAAQLMAKIAAIELPMGQWPELINLLLSNMAVESAELKKATLEALGYVCEEVSAEVLAQDQVNAMLTAVVQGMNSSETNAEVRLSATRALCNALDFAQTNFDNEVERSYIMRVVCEATMSPDMRVRQSAFECLVAIASTYYDKLQPYMQEIFNITSKAVRQDEEPAALQAIEFWSAICDEEIELQEGADSDYPATGFGFIKKALNYLVPLLLEAMTKQEEDQELEDDVWNLSMAAGTCLGLVARTVEDAIVPLVMPFIQENIVLPDWRRREAATYAFGSILEGPSLEKLTPLVNSALHFMLHAMTRDENRYVKDTTAWTLGRIFEFLHGPRVKVPVITPDNLPHILSTLLESLKDASNVAERTCGALYYLAQGFEDARPPSPLSPFFQNIVEALLITAARDDALESRLRSAAYETLNEVIRNSTEDTSQITVELVPVIIGKLNNTLYMTILSSDDKEKQGDLQALLCGVLQVIIQKLSGWESSRAAVVQFADQMMGLFLKVFACRSATVHEEAMLAIGALAYASGVSFGKYMQEFYPYLEMGLQNFEEYQVCAITVGVVGDICRALDEKVLPFCDGIMTHLLKDLSSSQLHRSVKPPIFSCFGDIALAIEGQFDKYLPYALPMLQGAAEITAQQANADEEVIEHNNQLRTGILEAYSGILQGFKSAKRSEAMLPHAAHVLQFIESIYRDKEDRDEGVTRAAVGVLGDLADSLGPVSADLFRQATFYKDFIDEVQAFDDVHLRNTAQWALVTISKLVS